MDDRAAARLLSRMPRLTHREVSCAPFFSVRDLQRLTALDSLRHLEVESMGVRLRVGCGDDADADVDQYLQLDSHVSPGSLPTGLRGYNGCAEGAAAL